MEIIDLSQDIFSAMPVHKSLPQVKIEMHASHEQWAEINDSAEVSPSVYKMEMSEHTGTHVDALNHMRRENKGESIDKMPLSMFYTMGICLDVSHKGFQEMIEIEDLKKACADQSLQIKEGETILI